MKIVRVNVVSGVRGGKMTIKPEVKEAIIKQHIKIKENKILILGLSIGIISSLIAGVINDLIKSSTFYPLKYLFILIVILFILVFVLLIPYLTLKVYLHGINDWMKEAKKVLKATEAHRENILCKK